MNTAYLVQVFGALFAIMNPFVNLPIFLSLTDGMSPGEQRACGMRVVLFSAIMCAGTAAGGVAFLNFFGISVDEFRVAGGLVLLLMGLGMLHGQQNTSHQGTKDEQKHHADLSAIAFYPVTFPIIVGPGTMTALILYVHQSTGPADMTAYVVAVCAVLGLLAIVLFFSSAIGHLMSQTLRVIMSRLMGMILIAISVGMLAGGLKAIFPTLAGAAS